MRGVGAYEIDIPLFVDLRGCLVAFQQNSPLPFKPVRVFVIVDVPPDAHRAQHEVSCDEFLWMAAGACHALVRASASRDDGHTFHLVKCGRGLYLPKGAWIDLFGFALDSVLVCMAEAEYEM